MLQLKKQSITELPLKEIATMTEVELESWCAKEAINRFESWLLPQLVAHFGSWRLVRKDSSIDVVETLKRNCEHDSTNTALWRLSRVPRTLLVTKQIAQPEYAVLTPLILAGFKRMQAVSYEQWRGCSHLAYVMEPRLWEAINVAGDALPSLGSERLLAIRQQGLTTKSGKTAGTIKNAETTWSLTGIQDTELGHLPKLTQSMLTQIWLAHPANRSNMMILDPSNWDSLPEPLISNDVFNKPEPKEIAPYKTRDQKDKEPDKLLPWM